MGIQVNFRVKRRGLKVREVKKILKKALEGLGLRDVEVSVLFTNDDEISLLNKSYRGKEGPTNVLAFSMLEGETVPHSKMLGDIVISLDTAEREAEQTGITLFSHVVRLMIHGLLHLVGYDHEEDEEAMAMEKEEERLIGLVKSSVA